VGLLLKHGIETATKSTIMQAISLAVILIGVRSALEATDLLGVIVCMALGGLMGEAMKIEAASKRWAPMLNANSTAPANGGFAKGFVTASLVFCVGSMAIVGHWRAD
jgi:uncharacterized membrane protein YqgA involved in biofilm formation